MFWKPCFWPSNMEITTVSCSWCWTAELYPDRCMNCHPNACIRKKTSLRVTMCSRLRWVWTAALSPAEAWLKGWHALFHKHNAAPCGVTGGSHVSKMLYLTFQHANRNRFVQLLFNCTTVPESFVHGRTNAPSLPQWWWVPEKKTSPSVTVRSVLSGASTAMPLL